MTHSRPVSLLSKNVLFLGKTSSEKNTVSEPSSRTLQRRHSVYESSANENRVLRRVASLTLGRNSAKKKRSSKSIICQKTNRYKQSEGKRNERSRLELLKKDMCRNFI